jgi:RNA polymerase sigma factor (TIGR02999 family)
MVAPSRKASHHQPGELTVLLTSKQPEALRTVLQLTYPELHNMAVRYFRQEHVGRTLQPTDILHESSMRLMEAEASFENRGHFFCAAARSMRCVLVDSARHRHAKKRDGDRQRVDFREAERIGFEEPKELLDFDTALTRLEEFKPRWSEIAELRIFGGLSSTEAAATLGIHASTARRRWKLAKDWLRKTLRP